MAAVVVAVATKHERYEIHASGCAFRGWRKNLGGLQLKVCVAKYGFGVHIY
jgi:hypothetical protein